MSGYEIIRLYWVLVLALGGVGGHFLGMAHGQLHEQIEALSGQLQRHPDDSDLLARRGELYRAHGLTSEARTDFERIERLFPNDPTNDLRLGQLAVDEGNGLLAEKRLTRFIGTHAESVEAHVVLARAQLLNRQPEAASQSFSKAILCAPEPHPDWFLARAHAQQLGGIPLTKIVAGLDEGLRRLGPVVSIELAAVEIDERLGNYDGALARIDEIARRAERKERWLTRRAELLLSAGRTNDARKAFVTALDALNALPDRLRRSWAADELRQNIEKRFAEIQLSSSTSTTNR